MSDLERVKAFNPDVKFPCPHCNQQARLADLDDHNNGRCICKECDGTGKVTYDCISCSDRAESRKFVEQLTASWEADGG